MMKCSDAFASKIFWRGLMTSRLLTWDSGAASIRLCQVLVEFGMTNPKSKFPSSRHRPLKSTFCSILNFSIGSIDEKLISLKAWVYQWLHQSAHSVHLDTALHFRIFFGTRASCSSSGMLRSSLPWERFHFLFVLNSISDSPATGSCPCPRHGGSSSWPEILTRCLLLLLAFCENLWRLRSVLKSILCGRRRSSLMFPCTTVFTISQRSPLSFVKFLFIWK